jgi:hypothetical protein
VHVKRALRVETTVLDEATIRGDRGDLHELHAQIVWLEACGWTLGADGLCRHPQKAAGEALLPAHAFAVEAGRHIDLRP